MNIICIKSCSVDGSAINALRAKCFNYNVPRCKTDNITGRYILAYHGSTLVGVADACGEEQTCVIPSYASFGVKRVLDAELAKVYA